MCFNHFNLQIDWFKYLNGVLKTIGKSVKGDDDIVLRGDMYFKQLGTILAATPKR